MADIKQAEGASAAVTVTLASLGTDSNLLTGRESLLVDNTSSHYLDYLIDGQIMTGTTPTTGKQIEVWCVPTYNDAFLFPDVFAGADAAKTSTSRDILNSGCRAITIMPTDATSNRSYYFAPVSIASLFGYLPKKFSIFVVHNTAVNLNATAGNHVITVNPRYMTVV